MPTLLMPKLKGNISLGFCNSFHNLHFGGGGQSFEFPSCTKPPTLAASKALCEK
jgi:hypothetical protein